MATDREPPVASSPDDAGHPALAPEGQDPVSTPLIRRIPPP